MSPLRGSINIADTISPGSHPRLHICQFGGHHTYLAYLGHSRGACCTENARPNPPKWFQVSPDLHLLALQLAPSFQAFETVMTRNDCSKSFFVSFDFTSDALAEIQSFFTKSHKVIIPLTVREILDEQIAMKLA